jgi:predicted dehydrogenase
MRVGIIGCGLIGRKRALALDKKDELAGCCDTNSTIGKKFAQDFKCKFYPDYKKLIDDSNCEAVVVAVVNKYIKEIVIYALKKGKHVIAEKPLGRNAKEAEQMIKTLNDANKNRKQKLILKTGFNHRFHPALLKAKNIFDSGEIGKLMFIRAAYGHGGRNGMEKEWRSSKDLCGGGELLDQGVHIIDLSRWFAGDISKIFGVAKTKFWNMKVEDNAFVYMTSKSGADVHFNVSWTNWKNIFSFEIFCTKGYMKISGFGGSYGKETLEVGVRKPEGGRPDIKKYSFPKEDKSWNREWREFKSAIKNNRNVLGDGIDGLKANIIIENIYKSNKLGKTVNIK